MRSILLGVLLAISACGGKSTPPAGTGAGVGTGSEQPAQAACVTGGCSGIVCSEAGNEMVTTCEFRPEYACYKTATCERQESGDCGWTPSAELTACLANPPAE